MNVTFSLPRAWRACFAAPMPPIEFFMRLHSNGVLQMWRNVPLWGLMQCTYDNFYGSPED